MEPQRQDVQAAIRQQAAHWVIVLDDDSGVADRAAFASWLRESPRHVKEYVLASATWASLDHIDSSHRHDIHKLIEESVSNVIPLTEAERGSRPAWSRGGVFTALACAAVVLVAGILVWTLSQFSPSYSDAIATRIGEQRAYKLVDGSVVHLNTDSRVEIRYSSAVREVSLLEGEALFTVEHDPLRPFKVMADHTLIQAVGTQFNVYLTSSGTTVTVIDGTVRIVPDINTAERLVGSVGYIEDDGTVRREAEPPSGAATPVDASGDVLMLTAGEQATIFPNGAIEPLKPENVIEAAAWRERRLIFRGKTLAEVASEFNRYNANRHLQVYGSEIRERRLSGVFDADKPESLIDFLEKDEGLTIRRNGEEIVIAQK